MVVLSTATTPPRTTLRLDDSLVQAGLVPAATAVLAWDVQRTPELAAHTHDRTHDRTHDHTHAALYLRADAARLWREPPAEAAVPFPEATSSTEDAGRPGEPSARSHAVATASSTGGANAAGATTRGSAAAKTGKPKWLKR